MRPKDLKHQFTFEERTVVLNDGVLFVPDYYQNYEDFVMPTWHEIFGNDNPVNVEYCSGNGEWVLERAMENPSINWIAVEKRFDRVRKIWSKAKNHNLKNLFIVCGEGNISTKYYFPESTISEVFINFPDPWPKKRHFKHRIIKREFLDNLCAVLKSRGSVTFVTDDINYSEVAIEEFISHSGFESYFDKPFFLENLSGYGSSYFERLWKELGRIIRFVKFLKMENIDVSRSQINKETAGACKRSF